MTTLTDKLDAMVAVARGAEQWAIHDYVPVMAPVFAALCEVARAADGLMTRTDFWNQLDAAIPGETDDVTDALTALERALEDGRG